MNITDILCAWAAMLLLFLFLAVVRWWYRTKNDQVLGSRIKGEEFDSRWADVDHSLIREREMVTAKGLNADPNTRGRAHTGSIAETHLGPITASKPWPNRVDRGFFGVGNRPPNAGMSKQIERLHLAGLPHASTVAMMDADCTQQERRVINMREAGDSLALIAERLGVSMAKVRRLEASAVDKIIAARKEPS